MRRNQYKGTLQGVEASEPYARGYADRAARFGGRTRGGTQIGRQASEPYARGYVASGNKCRSSNHASACRLAPLYRREKERMDAFLLLG